MKRRDINEQLNQLFAEDDGFEEEDEAQPEPEVTQESSSSWPGWLKWGVFLLIVLVLVWYFCFAGPVAKDIKSPKIDDLPRGEDAPLEVSQPANKLQCRGCQRDDLELRRFHDQWLCEYCAPTRWFEWAKGMK